MKKFNFTAERLCVFTPSVKNGCEMEKRDALYGMPDDIIMIILTYFNSQDMQFKIGRLSLVWHH